MAIGTTAAIIGASVIGAGASVYSGNKAAKAASKGADAAAQVQQYMYDTTREDQAPYRDVGTGALRKLAQMYGIEMDPETDWGAYVRGSPDLLAGYQKEANAQKGKFQDIDEFGRFHYEKYGKGEGRDLTPYQSGGISGSGGGAMYEDFYKSPDYQFRMDESMKALERSAAARGRLNSGATKSALIERAGNLASSEYNNYANRLAALAGVGQTATAQTGAAGAAAAGGIAQAYQNAGNARASAYQNTGQAISNTVGNLATAYLYNKGWGQQLPPAGGPMS